MVNVIKGAYTTTKMSMSIFTLIMNEIYKRAPRFMKQMATGTIWIR
jgi:hypothetical protein